MKNLIKFITAVTIISAAVQLYSVSTAAAASDRAADSYSFSYDDDNGFSIPYMTVSADEVTEPEYAVGEIHEKNMNSNVLEIKLPNGNTLEMEMPIYYYTSRIGDSWAQCDDTIYIYDDEGELISTRIFNDADMPQGLFNPTVTTVPGYMPMYYKGNLFFKRFIKGGILKVNTETLDVERVLPSFGLYPFEITEKTIFESGGGYEIFPGTFIKGVHYCYPTGERYTNPNYIYAMGNAIKYSYDGIYYIKVENPNKSWGEILHGMVDGEDCLCFTSDNTQYMIYKISDLKQCWTECVQDAPYVHLNGVRLAFDTPPIIENGITMMPLRYLLETAGATVEWEAESKSALISYNNTEIKITENENIAYINGKSVPIGTTPKIMNEKMMIPLRFISEELGFSVEWEQDTRTIRINTQVDNINTFVSVLSPVEIRDSGTILNGEPIKTVIAGGRTFIPIEFLKKHFSVSTVSSSDSEHYELALLTEPDNSVDLTAYDFYCRSTDMVCIHRYSLSAKLNDICIPTYSTRSNIDATAGNTAGLYSFSDKGFICVEEAADRLNCLHYEWIEEEGTLYVYISADMVTYDDALKAILDKKDIPYHESYTCDYYKDIDAMQQYSKNDLSALVQAGINAGIIKESDYQDGHLRPTRNISHIDFARMLKGIGYEYSYNAEQTNIPLTFEEFDMLLSEL